MGAPPAKGAFHQVEGTARSVRGALRARGREQAPAPPPTPPPHFSALNLTLAPRPTRRAATANAAVATIGAKQQRLGGVLVRCEGVSIDTPRGDPLLRAFDYDFQRHERVGIIGPNGAGKTTLLRVLLGEFEQKIAEGSITRGDTVRFAHFDQAGLRAPGDMRVQQFVAEAVAAGPGGGSRDETDRKVTRMLNRFLFPPGRWHERVERLSGGEQRRLW